MGKVTNLQKGTKHFLSEANVGSAYNTFCVLNLRIGVRVMGRVVGLRWHHGPQELTYKHVVYLHLFHKRLSQFIPGYTKLNMFNQNYMTVIEL